MRNLMKRQRIVPMSPSTHETSQRFIRSVHGSYLRVRLGFVGKYRNTCEHWYIEDMNGKYLRANPSGFIDLADQDRAWEEWTIVRNSNGTVSFLSHHGTWLRAEKDGEVSLGMRSNEDEQFTLRCW
ncbi:hypothetical protein PRIPAC_96081 [Pristionchus pacificus]|uniref:Uncharacterized protein n=1 Tax=Pristionchus pacificus TaxID=54126 RepID=A0A2A6D262_PRIPA|nr:hypothetical protein PRIPAC_96081 [Pristionchus pacificus]|eukprot:PDM84479.1 hypothetical protein PRIPAC_33502 [Pristionchus pacificus]